MSGTNPFGVYNPEQQDSDYIAQYFVDVHTDLPHLLDPNNTFILGARGTGKSMLLRSLEPEIMIKIGKAKSLEDLNHLAFHVPIKKVDFAPPELERHTGYAGISISEHLLAMHIMYRLMRMLETLSHNFDNEKIMQFSAYYCDLYKLCGGHCTVGENYSSSETNNNKDLFNILLEECHKEIVRIMQFIKRFSQPNDTVYSGALTGFIDFIVPVLEKCRECFNLPHVPFFMMIDDADNLPRDMQRVLNSWVSTRSTHVVCLKITTQLGYATFRTLDNRIIESPHDFSEVNIGTIYTSKQDRYYSTICEIVSRRLEIAGLDATPESFFPRDEPQASRLEQIREEIRSERAQARSPQHTQRLVGNSSKKARTGADRVRDEVNRYAVPRLIRELAGRSKSGHTFSYAGFRSLVDLSSGVVRWFLDPASHMYDRVAASGTKVESIPVGVQDTVIKEWSSNFLRKLEGPINTEKEATTRDEDPEQIVSKHALGHEGVMYERLRNLIDGLGRLFYGRLMDPDASEQRVFSVVVRGKPSKDLREVLDMAIRLGYLQTSDNAAKEALGGRLPRYILARRLGAHYRLDISGYAAHLSVQSDQLQLAMSDPDAFVRMRLDRQIEDPQLPLELHQRDSDA